ncbi:MAG: glucose-1-phosphate adenylyltransferase subunit GlgD [Lachnospiraceae bacterium]
MMNVHNEALGIIFPNSYDSLVPQLVTERSMASIPFGSRYRMIDFILSSMVNSGIDNVAIIVRQNYHSLMDHLGTGREWDLARKNGGLNIFPPYAEKTVKLYTGRIEALESILLFLRSQKEKYVILTDANLAVNFDFTEMMSRHIESGADITIAYQRTEIPAGLIRPNEIAKDLYYTLALDGTRVNKIFMNQTTPGVKNLSMNIYIVDRELLIDLVNSAYVRGMNYFERDVLAEKLDELNIQGYEYDGYVARITDMKSYFDENMKLLDDKNLDALFSGNTIYTKIRDDNPTRYIGDANAKNVLVADGCVIEGTIENCVLFRGVKIGKGAVVKNCVLMQDTVVGDNAKLDHVITDKNVTISAGKELVGTESFPVYAEKNRKI